MIDSRVYETKFMILDVHEAQWLWTLDTVSNCRMLASKQGDYVIFECYGHNPNGSYAMCFRIQLMILDTDLDIITVQGFISWYLLTYHNINRVGWKI